MKLEKEFYLCDGLQLSRKLIGKVLCRQTDNGLLRARIIETEAYMGSGDKAAHASKGKTNRTSVLFEEGGKAYIYLIYGMYCCLNISANIAEVPDCVLIRSAEPLDGIQQMCKNRNTENLFNLCSGPGKLCQAFSLTKHDNATDLDSDRLWIEDDGFTVDRIAVSKRINIDYAQEAIDFPWRFYIPESRYLSVKIKK
ncbi:MAG: DNA-3-methyladenine glycosylase [Clostridia bacterium]|nr:DNA-3-methyladenine glycosylase [Clostridia bacterium]